MSRILCLIMLSLCLVQGAEAEESAKDHISAYLTQKFGLAETKAAQISDAVQAAAAKYSLPPALLLAIISIESRFKEKAKGPRGATGLMQVVPAAHRGLLKNVKDLTEPDANIEAGSAILHGYLQSAGGDLNLALKNYGGSMAYAQKVSMRVETFAPVVARQGDGLAAASQTAACDASAADNCPAPASGARSFFIPARSAVADPASMGLSATVPAPAP
ncbi:lytic transglycosylase domain-containing protein [Paraburkholderia sp. DHOC27]|uniref:lytic transglycosylase domain-containing protein n=1 Tax=Paraburkholderia sp. DHOC27 TaxID=2303330 RepID=UPI000E3D77FB|nr:transglycosylase SLT domain-containing protein [Paraburkholderia sp. DHOC27]RFU43733.1 lytic transglycosylase domain-containing protein [Paraburkholderia sp. DHOC27]